MCVCVCVCVCVSVGRWVGGCGCGCGCMATCSYLHKSLVMSRPNLSKIAPAGKDARPSPTSPMVKARENCLACGSHPSTIDPFELMLPPFKGLSVELSPCGSHRCV